MRTVTLSIVACLGFTAPALADGTVRATYRGSAAPAIDAKVDSDLPALLTFYKDLHANPELSLQEKESSRKIAERLMSLGYAVTTNLGGHGVVGVMDNGPGPTLLIRGDMDALPVVEETGLPYASKVKAKRPDGQEVGVMHACGHDVHQTCLVGTAAVLAALKNKWSGKVLLVAQPAEEIVAGAQAMIADGLFEKHGKADLCIALHVSADKLAGTVAYTPGWALANSDSIDLTVYGRGGHGSRPHDTVDPIVIASHVVTALQTIVSRRVDPLDSAVITVGSIHAGSKHNIIPDEARLQLTVRSYTPETRKLLLDGIRQVATNTCRALGSPKDPLIVHHEEEHAPATWNDPALTEAASEVFKKVLGPDKVVENKPVMGAEDFGRFGTHLKVPSLMFWLGSVPQERYEKSRQPGAEPLPSAHSSKYYPDPEPTIRTGVTCMSHLALALLAEKN